MRARIEVADRKEADNIRKGLALPEIRALVITMGALSRLPNHRAKVRMMQFVREHFAEQDAESSP